MLLFICPDDYNDYANDYEDDGEDDEEDEDLLDDEEYEEFDDEEPSFDASGELDLESLINIYSMDSNLQADDESTGPHNDPVQGNTISIDGEMRLADGLINDEIRRSVDYLIGQSRSIVNSTADPEEQMNRMNMNLNEDATSSTIDRLVEQEVMNRVGESQPDATNSTASSSSDQAASSERSRLSLGGELNLLADSDDLDSPLVPRTAEDAAQLAETGEPIGLCRLRRRAVKVLAARIRTEKEYYEKRENELRKKLDCLVARNEELEGQLGVQPHSNALLLFSTAVVFCSLISYFMQTLN